MRGKQLIAYLFLAVSLLSACTTTPSRPTDQAACVGTVMEAPPGLVEVEKAELLREAVHNAGEGGLCTAKVFRVEHPLTVYRVWDADRKNQFGRWWSFMPPQGPREAYREANAICESYSALDRASACTLKPGAFVVIGPGQSVNCNNTGYPKSAVNQVYIHNDVGQLLVDNCISKEKWPAAAQ